jgi:hypothetical protein
MTDLLQEALEFQQFCEAQCWSFCIIGGLAVQRWSESRVTRDIDLALLTGFGQEENFVDVLLAHYSARHPDSRQIALRNRVLLLVGKGGLGIDVSLAALPFEESAIARATPFTFSPGLTLRTCSAEDLMVFKLFASRPLDLRDAEGIAIRNRDTLDWAYIETHLAPLVELKEAPEIMTTLAAIRDGHYKSF